MTAAASVTGTTFWVAAGDDPRVRAYSLWAVPARLSRDIYCGVAVLAGMGKVRFIVVA